MRVLDAFGLVCWGAVIAVCIWAARDYVRKYGLKRWGRGAIDWVVFGAVIAAAIWGWSNVPWTHMALAILGGIALSCLGLALIWMGGWEWWTLPWRTQTALAILGGIALSCLGLVLIGWGWWAWSHVPRIYTALDLIAGITMSFLGLAIVVMVPVGILFIVREQGIWLLIIVALWIWLVEASHKVLYRNYMDFGIGHVWFILALWIGGAVGIILGVAETVKSFRERP